MPCLGRLPIIKYPEHMRQFTDNTSASFQNSSLPNPLHSSGKIHQETNQSGNQESGELKESQGVVKEDLEEEQKIWQILYEVKDPEVPVLSIIDLGIVRSVHYTLPAKAEPISSNPESASVEVLITPTYSGCPAMDVIRMDIRLKLLEHGYKNIVVNQSLSPAWTSDWITEEGKKKLKEFGIAPPNPKQQFCTSEMFKEHALAFHYWKCALRPYIA